MKKIKMSKVVAFIFMIFFLVLFCFSAYKIINWYLSNQENKKINEEISDSITITKGEFKIDFDKLKSKNSDTIAYLNVPGTNIDYIVVRHDNNSYYLDHNFNKEYNISGWVFGDYRNNFDGNDKNIIIYGHNTMDGSMFGSLKNVLNESWNDGQKITLITEKEKTIYEPFSVYQIEAEDYYIRTAFKENEFNKFLKNLESRSVYDFNVDLSDADSILTLSTCSDNGKKRVVLHAKKIK